VARAGETLCQSLRVMAWSSESHNRARRRQAVERLSIDRRLELLRTGQMAATEIADFAADVGSQNYIEAERDINQLLDHSDAIVRYNAMATLAYEWGRTSRVDRIQEILSTDPDRDCRRQAAGALGSLFRGTQTRDVLEMLVGAARNPHEEMDVRAFAYTAALDVVGVSRAIQLNPIGLQLGPDELLALDEYLKTLR
jgi:HEAT repeats